MVTKLLVSFLTQMILVMCRFHPTSVKQEIPESESNQVVEWKCTSVTQETQPIVKSNIQGKTEPLRVEAVIINLWNK